MIDTLHAVQDARNFEGRYTDDIVASGVTAVNYTIPWLEDDLLPALQRISICHEYVEEHQDKYLIIRTTQDIQKAKKEGKIGVIIGSQNARMIGDDLRLLKIFKELGEYLG
ncbi:membrane dipeptidase [Chloroflexota bacterium]